MWLRLSKKPPSRLVVSTAKLPAMLAAATVGSAAPSAMLSDAQAMLCRINTCKGSKAGADGGEAE